MEFAVTFAQALKQHRKAQELTQRQLAHQVGCATVTIQRIEQGTLRPSAQIVRRLADIFALAPVERADFVRLARSDHTADAGAAPEHATGGARGGQAYVPLPAPLTPLVGRAREVALVCARLENPAVRLVTLTGPGGIGKTRLALQVGGDLQGDFADGAVFVDLAPIADPDLVVHALAQALGVREVGGQPLQATLAQALRDQHRLLVLDNFEQVVDAAELVTALLQAAPQVKVLLTSRVVVGVYGDHLVEVPPLAYPDPAALPPLEQLMEYEAIRLFADRARAMHADVAVDGDNAQAVAAICAQLDGLPLAIELAAARIRLFPPQTLLARLEHRLPVLTDGPRTLPARQQTLRATLDWSYHLLTPAEQRLFMWLAVFVGGWTLEAAEAVCASPGDLGVAVLDGMHALVDHHLVRRDLAPPISEEEATGRHAAEPRFGMFETIREYARERLEASGEGGALRQQHAQYMRHVAETPVPARGDLLAQRMWLDHLEQELDNLRAALRFLLDDRQAEYCMRLGTALAGFWPTRGNRSEGRAWLTAALALNEEVAPAVRANALLALADLEEHTSAWNRVATYREEGLRLFAQSGDRYGLARAYLSLGHSDEALRLFEELGDQQGVAMALDQRASTFRLTDYAAARAGLEEALGRFRTLEDTISIINVLEKLGGVARDQEDFAAAQACFVEGLALARHVGYAELIAVLLHSWAEMALLQGDDVSARARWEESVALFRVSGNKALLAYALHGLGYVADHEDDMPGMVMNFTESLRLFCELDHRLGIDICLAGFAAVAARQGQPDRAGRLFGAAATVRAALGMPRWHTHHLEIERNVAVARAQADDVRFKTAWADGQAMALEQAIGYALDDKA